MRQWDRGEIIGHAHSRRRALLCAADISATAPGPDLAARLTPGVPITNPAPHRADPWRALVDCSVAETTLGGRPSYRWSEHEQIESGAHP